MTILSAMISAGGERLLTGCWQQGRFIPAQQID
jgi:hypothetical protein